MSVDDPYCGRESTFGDKADNDHPTKKLPGTMAGQVWGRCPKKLVETGWADGGPGPLRAALRRIAGRERHLLRLHVLRPGRRMLRDDRRRGLRQHHHFGADLHALVKIGHILVGEADAAARYALADGGRIVGAVNAIFGAADIHGARAEPRFAYLAA